MANDCQLDDVFVRARLAELGLSQRALADELGFELRTLQRWMAGGRIGTPDAERIAMRLGRGMGAVCRSLPDAYTHSPLERLAPFVRFLERRDEVLAGPFRMIDSFFSHWVSLVQFHAQPVERFVARFPVDERFRHRFVPLLLDFGPGAPEGAFARFHAQVSPRMRYLFGEVRLRGDRARLEEYAFTRAMESELGAERAVRVDVWVAAEMREVVIASDHPFEARRIPVDGEPTDLFDRTRPELERALCFRPSAMDLRLAGLPAWDDRLRPTPL